MLLITDLDGTLLTSQKTISPRTRQALIAFRQNGGLLAACSARPVSSMVRLLRQQQVDTLFSWCAGFNCVTPAGDGGAAHYSCCPADRHRSMEY